ncbi:hypothetical protein RF679_11730 [Undibacterium cyanobacteriorum]|uniref:Uncharacterized protein n=1 Tax=Undibacterium cyanobacteriorum TaxID=3073561 RepID=A0ABY9REM5_9BURK|nr:hypothetical protein [Undibacterium sp. 20NA77.5]WMW79318.1 hypothetical protein RF679_11730 [Undibacterium sp. 20NA77.5]
MIEYYLPLSVVVGIVQLLDGLLFLARRGRASVGAVLFSLIEWIWGGVSLYVLRQEAAHIPSWLPITFMVFLVGWTLYGLANVKRFQKMDEVMLTPIEAILGGLFGIVFASAAFVCL